MIVEDRFRALFGIKRGGDRADFAVSREAELRAGFLNVEDFLWAWCRHANTYGAEFRPAGGWLLDGGYEILDVLLDDPRRYDEITFADAAGNEYVLSLNAPDSRVELSEMDVDGKYLGEAEYATAHDCWVALPAVAS
jgi:hypothetical protein